MTVTGPDFIALQVLDLERAAQFYETQLGLIRAPHSPENAVLFMTEPIPFAVRTPLPGVNLQHTPHPGLGVALWMHCTDTQQLHDSLEESGVTIIQEPTLGPFGLTFTFTDPDGYTVTVHDKA